MHPRTPASEWRDPAGRTQEISMHAGVGFAVLLPLLIVIATVIASNGGGSTVGSGDDGEGGGSFLGYAIFVVIVPAFTIFTVMLLGLPVRLMPGAWRWWTRYGEISLAGTVAGLAMVSRALATDITKPPRTVPRR